MTIPAEDIWVYSHDKTGATAHSLENSLRAPDEFQSIDDVEAFVQVEYDDGEYTILTPETTVSVTRQQDTIDETLSDDNIDLLNSVADRIEERVDGVLWVAPVDSSNYNTRHFSRNGIELECEPTQYDIGVKALLNDRDYDDVVADIIDAAGDDVRYIGDKTASHYERRGARGQPGVRVGFTLPSDAEQELFNIVDEHDRVVDAFADDTITYLGLLAEDTDLVHDHVIVTDVEVDAIDGGTPADDVDEELFNAHETHTEAFHEQLEEHTQWHVVSIGCVTSTESDTLSYLALGVN